VADRREWVASGLWSWCLLVLDQSAQRGRDRAKTDGVGGLTGNRREGMLKVLRVLPRGVTSVEKTDYLAPHFNVLSGAESNPTLSAIRSTEFKR